MTKNFKKEEFESRDGAKMPKWVENNIKLLCNELEIIRKEVGEPIYINSGYRSKERNKIIKGAKNSYHLKGLAADIWCKNTDSRELGLIILNLMNEGKIKKGGLKVYKTWVHYDIRGKEARW